MGIFLVPIVTGDDAQPGTISPEQVWVDAARDLRTAKAHALHIRYLSLWNLPEQAKAGLAKVSRADWAKVLSGHVNGLSREPLIVIPPLLFGHLLRIDLDDYRIDPKVWEQLAQAKPVGEPHFHIQVEQEETQDWGYYQQGDRRSNTPFPGGVWVTTEKKKTGKKKIVSAIAPWLAETPAGAAAVAYLVEATGSSVPVVSADWFLYQTAIQDQRAPGYYDFLEVKDEKDFWKLIGFVDDRKLVDPGFLQQIKESVALSDVTLQPRSVERWEKIGGAYWRTRDVRLAKDKANPLRVLDDALKFDASEQFGGLPNKLWATGIFDAQGKRQDAAPPFIATDSETTSRDTQVHVNLSCLRCHREGGLRSIDGWVRGVLNSPPNELKVLDPKKVKEFRYQYTSDLTGALADDRAGPERAIALATGGWPWRTYANKLGAAWEQVVDTPVTAERAARDVGCSAEALRAELEKAKIKLGILDPVLAAFTRDKPAKLPLEVWWEALPLAQFNRRGVGLPADVKIIPAERCREAFPLATWIKE